MRVRNLRVASPQYCISGREYLFVTDVKAVIASVDVVPDGDTELFWKYTATITYPDGTIVEGTQVLLSSVSETASEKP